MDKSVALQELRDHLQDMEYLWRAVIAFEGDSFETAGRGRNHTGAVKFRYVVSRHAGAGGRHYEGQAVGDYGNELWIYLERPSAEEDGSTNAKKPVPKAKSISRSTVDLAYRNAQDIQKAEGRVSGPRKLGVPGSRSYLYAMFLEFGLISR